MNASPSSTLRPDSPARLPAADQRRQLPANTNMSPRQAIKPRANHLFSPSSLAKPDRCREALFHQFNDVLSCALHALRRSVLREAT